MGQHPLHLTRADPRSRLEALGGDAGQGRALNRITLGPPTGLTRDTEHRAFSRAGVANNHGEIAGMGDMVQSVALFAPQVKGAALAGGERPPQSRRRDLMSASIRNQSCRALQPLLHLDHLAGAEAFAAPPVHAQRH